MIKEKAIITQGIALLYIYIGIIEKEIRELRIKRDSQIGVILYYYNNCLFDIKDC
jgi:hypothetical protein